MYGNGASGGRGGGGRNGSRGRGRSSNTAYPQPGPYGAPNHNPAINYQAPAYPQGTYSNQPVVYSQPGQAYGSYGHGPGAGGPRGAPGAKKPPKIAQHVQIDPSMVFNVATFFAPGENKSPLSCFAVSCLPPASAGQPPRVSVYTGDASGVMREFTHNGSWVQTRRAQHEGPVLSLLAVDVWLFVGIQQSLPNGIFGVVKAYNLATNTQTVLQDPRGLSGAHYESVRSMCAAQQYLITGGGDGQVKAWSMSPDATTGESKWVLQGVYGGGAPTPGSAIPVIAMTGKCVGSLITGQANGELKSWRLLDGTLQQSIQAHTGSIAAIDVLTVGPDNNFVVTCGADDSYVRLWKGPQLERLYEMTVQPPPAMAAPGMTARANPVTALKIVQVGQQQHLFVGMRNGNVAVYHMKDVRHFEKIGYVDGHQRQASVLGFEILSVGQSMLCLVTDNGFVNWFRLLQ